MPIHEDANTDSKSVILPRRWKLLAYCIALGSTPFFLLVAALLITPTDWTIRHSGNVFLANIGYVTKLNRADCQVVIYGDSAAMEDLDPAIIRQRTGLSACNIAEPANMMIVNGTLVPDLYLQNNSRPKVWVFAFAADNLAPYKTWESIPPFEALVFRIRQRKDFSTLKLLLEHPKQTIEFAGFGLRLALLGVIKHPLPSSDYEIRSKVGGQYPSPDPQMTACPTERLERPSDSAYLAVFRDRYGGEGTKVILDVVPKPECDPTLEYYALHTASTDNKLEIYPLSHFDNHGHSHMKELGVTRFSNAVSDQILEAVKPSVALTPVTLSPLEAR